MNQLDNFANSSVLQFTLREMQGLIGKSTFWLVLIVVVLIATISGPFSTLEDFSLAPRFAYWASIVVLTALAATATSTFVAQWLRRRGTNEFLMFGTSALAASLPVTLIVWFITAYVAGTADTGISGLLRFTPNTIPISFVVAMGFQVMGRTGQSDVGAACGSSTIAQQDVAFLKRLPLGLGKDIYALQAQDHYVLVITARGQEMILVRFEDAIREMEGIKGLRVHRSWWVTDSAVARLNKSDGKTTLTLKSDMVVPVSRSHQFEVRKRFSDR